MNFEKLNEKVFDGDDETAYTTEMCCSTKSSSIRFKLQELIEYSILAKSIHLNELSHINAKLGFEVINFDGETIFQGRKKGLRLYGLLKNDVPREIFLFSCGEFQPGRFQIFLEGHVEY